MDRRVFLIVLDSFGIGEEPDAKDFGDVGSNTLKSISRHEAYDTPLMKEMGLFNCDGIDYADGVANPIGAYGRFRNPQKEKTLLLDTGRLPVSFQKSLFQHIQKDFLIPF